MCGHLVSHMKLSQMAYDTALFEQLMNCSWSIELQRYAIFLCTTRSGVLLILAGNLKSFQIENVYATSV